MARWNRIETVRTRVDSRSLVGVSVRSGVDDLVSPFAVVTLELRSIKKSLKKQDFRPNNRTIVNVLDRGERW